MKLLRVLGVLLWASVSVQAQTTLKIMSYNLLHFPGTLVYDEDTGQYISRDEVLKQIMDTYEPDILMVCELGSSQGADEVLNALQTPDMKYNRGNFAYNQSSDYQDLQQLVFYNQQKLSMVDEDIITTYVRDINRYTFQLNTTTSNVYLDVFVAHLKASQGDSNENSRYQMVQELTGYFEDMPSDRYVLVGGDFNLYYSDEPAYLELLDPTNAIVLKDPLNESGYWHNDSDFTAIHTQSTLTSNWHFKAADGGSDGSTGGLDDRFDFILTSENLLEDTNLHYVEGSYASYGNNGNCFNKSIDDPSCTGIYSQNLRDHLHNMSDHLPVVMELYTPYTLANETWSEVHKLQIVGSNCVSSQLDLQVDQSLDSSRAIVYNMLGQRIGSYDLSAGLNKLNVETLETGLYILRLKGSEKALTTVKFIKI